MKRQIKKYGNTIVIALKPQDLLDNDWEEGDFLDLSDVVKTKIKNKK